MTPRIASLLEYTFARKQDGLRRDADWAPLLSRFVSEGVSDEVRARVGLQEMIRAESERPAFLDGERIAFTRTVRQIPELHTVAEMNARRAAGTAFGEKGVVFNVTADFAPTIRDGLGARLSEIRSRLVKAREEGDACALACADGSVDAVTCAFGFRNFPDRAAALREAARVLAPDGHLLVLELFRPRFRLLAAATAAWMACVARLFARGAREDYAYLRASVETTCSAAAFERLAVDAGFAAVQRIFYLPACSCLLFRRNMVK